MSIRWFTAILILLHTTATAQTPTWSSDVACIVYNNCSSCHNDGGIAPFSLRSYEEAKPFAQLIREVVVSGQMPPWPPDPDYRRLANERLLSEAEIQTIEAWVAAGAPAGDLSQAPDPPDLSSQALIPDPDLVINLPAYTSQAVHHDDYRCFVVSTGMAEDTYITGFEVIPGNRNIVHHVLVFSDDSGRTHQHDANDPGPGYVCFGGVRSESAKMIGAWVPGERGQFLPEGMGIPLPANSEIVVQLHYPEGSAGAIDQTKINFRLSRASNLRSVNNDFVLNHFTTMDNGPLYIPANTVKTFRQSFRIPLPVTVIGAAPHMHLIGRSIKTWAETPAGQIIPLIDIPEWDFEWQGFYRFQEAVVLPLGTILRSEAVYDNTRNNPHNPNDPPQPVSVGEATTDEMMLVSFTWMPFQAGDRNLILTTDDSDQSVACQTTTAASVVRSDDPALRLFPNPVAQQLHLRLDKPWQGAVTVRIYDFLGRVVDNRVMDLAGPGVVRPISVAHLPQGQYRLLVTDGREALARSFVKQ